MLCQSQQCSLTPSISATSQMPLRIKSNPSATAGHVLASGTITSDATRSPVTKLYRDVLSIIFMFSSPRWEQAPVTLSSVCRRWRETALATPRLWSRIDLEVSQNLNYVEMYLNRSKSVGHHVNIPSPLNVELHELLSSASHNIVCMKILDSYQFLQHEFPILERLEMENSIYGDRTADRIGRQYLCDGSRFPRLRELCVIGASSSVLRAAPERYTGFLGLQKLEVVCKWVPDWSHIIQGLSSTLVSLRLGILSQPVELSYQFSFPQLRHLQIDTYNEEVHLNLDIDAPLLESVDEGCLVTRKDFTKIRLRNPASVRHLHTGVFPLDLAPYPGLRTLWIRGIASSTRLIIQSLQSQLSACPVLEQVFYFDRLQYRKTGWGEFKRCIPSSLHGRVFLDICALIQATGREIAVHEYNPSELDLPGSMQRGIHCLKSRCEAEISPDFSNVSNTAVCGGRRIRRV